jgi:hypothetical protein
MKKRIEKKPLALAKATIRALDASSLRAKAQGGGIVITIVDGVCPNVIIHHGP